MKKKPAKKSNRRTATTTAKQPQQTVPATQGLPRPKRPLRYSLPRQSNALTIYFDASDRDSVEAWLKAAIASLPSAPNTLGSPDGTSGNELCFRIEPPDPAEPMRIVGFLKAVGIEVRQTGD